MAFSSPASSVCLCFGRLSTDLCPRTDEDKFITLGYIAQAYCEVGNFELMLHYSMEQMELANNRCNDFMKSEALLNLSKAYERLADFPKAINLGHEVYLYSLNFP